MRRRVYALLIIAASARVFMPLIAMPPYAGLDEIQHVAHLVFFAQEHRSASTHERSKSWPDVVRTKPHLVVAKRLTLRDRRPYVVPNHEAQQPPLYYVLAGPIGIRTSAVSELRSWQLIAGLFAIVTVVAAAREALFGPSGVVTFNRAGAARLALGVALYLGPILIATVVTPLVTRFRLGTFAALLFFRRILPRRTDPVLDAPLETTDRDRINEQRYRDAISEEERHDPFTAMRYAEGVRWRQVLAKSVSPPARVLDVGAGNGAVELAFSSTGFRIVSVETEWNRVAKRLGVQRVIASANALPFRDATFDAVLLLETIEHLSAPADSFQEVARTMRSSAMALITTPPRWRYALRRDPHFGIRFLTLQSPERQRQIAARRGFDQSHHYVDRIYSSTNQIARTIAPLRIERVLSRSRLPRRWFWDAIIARR